MIRSTKHFLLNNINSEKLSKLSEFINLYQQSLNDCIDYIWNNKLYDQNNVLCWNIEKDILNLPLFLDYNQVDWKDSTLSARCKSSILTQAIGIIKGTVGIRKHLLFKIEKRKVVGLSNDKFLKLLNKNKISKPIVKNCFAELSSKNIDIKKSSGFFDYWIKIRSTNLPEIKISVKLSKMDKKWINKKGVLLGGISIGKNCISLRYEVPETKRTEGIIVGCDTGIKSPITLSNQPVLETKDNHGHTLESIQNTLKRKKKGSKAFKKTQKHRSNYINWFVNQLNFDNIQKVNLENVSFIGERKSRYCSHWVYGEIKERLTLKCEELGVQVSLHNAGYFSQRCSCCGLVLKSNRKGKLYKCINCKIEIDSDLNGAKNHELELPEIPIEMRQNRSNMKGFFWKEEGIFDYIGQERRVPDINLQKKEKDLIIK